MLSIIYLLPVLISLAVAKQIILQDAFDGSFAESSQCDPINRSFDQLDNDDGCLYNMPNDFYLKKSNDTPSGYIVNLQQNQMPSDRVPFWGRVDPTAWNRRDGWSSSSFIMLSGFNNKQKVSFEYAGLKAVKGNQKVVPRYPEYAFASHMNIMRSMEDESPTLLIDAETGERIPHWIEEDYSTSPQSKNGQDESLVSGYDEEVTEVLKFADMKFHDAERLTPFQQESELKNFGNKDQVQTLLMWPAKLLKRGHRYIVVIKKLVKADAENLQFLDAPDGFRVVRDDLPTDNSALQQRKLHFESTQLLQSLVRFGHVKNVSDLYIAWDFTTSSLLSTTEHLRHMRDDGYDKIENDVQFDYQIKKVQDNFSRYMHRRVEGTFKVPLYLTTAIPSIFGTLRRNESAQTYAGQLRPISNSYVDVDFVALIPKSSIRNPGNATIMHYGHGLFADRYEIQQMYLQRIANEQNYVLIATDWWGMQKQDLVTFVHLFLGNLGKLDAIPDRISQGVLNQLMLTRLFKQSNISSSDAFMHNNQSVIHLDALNKPTSIFYNGNSLGGIMGTLLMSLSADLKWGVLGVPGSPFSMLFPRNAAGSQILSKGLPLHFQKMADRSVFYFLLSQLYDLAGPSGYADIIASGGFLSSSGEIVNDLPAGLGQRKLLYQLGLGDLKVSSIAGMQLLRYVNASVYPHDPYETRFKLFTGAVVTRDFEVHINATTMNPLTLLPSITKSTHGMIPHSIATVYRYQKLKVTGSFHNIPPLFIDQLTPDPHEFPRKHPRSVQQYTDFIQVGIDQSRRGRYDDDAIWVKQACQNGCWNVPLPKDQPDELSLQ
ncbi:hypothetical protein MIR68_009629 [Amoeboaphelidium protococcarum]|nr:hypothetical protein MIR68_009629 [Amoeboaphelidium protococcarum]